MSANEDLWRQAREVARQAIADGRLVETGWQTLAKAVGLTDTRSVQWGEMRKAFFCGAHFMLDSVMAATDDEQGVTENDLRRMASVASELDRFNEELRKEMGL